MGYFYRSVRSQQANYVKEHRLYRVSAETLQRLYIQYFDFYMPLEEKSVAIKPDKEAKETNHMLKNNYGFNFPTN